jgi:hypothetical protein
MKTQIPLLTMTVPTAAELPRLRFAALGGGLCAAGAKALGVVETDTGAGGVAPVNVTGILLVQAGGAINAGVEVESNALGQALTLAGGKSNGYAIDAAVQAGDVIRIVRGI